MAARLITLHASNAEIATLRAMFTIFESDQISARIDEYSEMNIRFHQAIIGLSRCDLLAQIAENLFIHMRAIRVKTISEDNRARSEEHTSELQSLMRISYAVFCLKKKKNNIIQLHL